MINDNTILIEAAAQFGVVFCFDRTVQRIAADYVEERYTGSPVPHQLRCGSLWIDGIPMRENQWLGTDHEYSDFDGHGGIGALSYGNGNGTADRSLFAHGSGVGDGNAGGGCGFIAQLGLGIGTGGGVAGGAVVHYGTTFSYGHGAGTAYGDVGGFVYD